MANKVVKYLLSVVLLFTAVYGMAAKVEVPEKPNPPRLVNDYAGIFKPEQVKFLEDTLSQFARKTSNQVVVVTMSDLGEYTPNQMATEIGQSWGVGQAKTDNGVVILIKPKNKTKGEVFLAPGQGLQGALTDGFCGEIIRNEMIPQFKMNNYFGAVQKAIRIILPVAAGEYSFEDYQKDHEDPWWVTLGALALIAGVCYLLYRSFRGGNGSSGLGTALFLGSMSSGGRHSSGGYRGGGFGGFGGGGFDGGGAGGSW